MKTTFQTFVIATLLLASTPSSAAIQIFACEPEWGAVAREIGGNDVEIFTATTALQDPHRIEPRPSLIAKARKAELLICSGAGLESGWLPLLLRQAGNGRIQPGQPGHLMAAMEVERLDIPTTIDRTMGDIHSEGNPHVHLDPRRIATIASVLTTRLKQIDPQHSTSYETRARDFAERWQAAIVRWEKRGQPLRNIRVISSHQGWSYLFDWLGVIEAGQLEPKPGVPPSAGHLAELKRQLATKPARMVIYAAYQDERSAVWLSRESGIPAVQLPFTVGGSDKGRDLFALFDDTLDRMEAALHGTR